ncbi:MAG: hypothetical protein E4G96_05680 [Chrysiogenales bacterium]|nr:MAG: hypothetical protein E4G96_05680 [Chrysiogenales bacterium]
MKKKIIMAALVLICAASGSPGKDGGDSATDHEWGARTAKIKDAIGPGKCIEFTPSDDPEYQNKIMSYITAIDGELAGKIKIVRVQTRPVVDYLFVNDRLYTVMEDWGPVDPSTENDIRSRLSLRFGTPLVQKDNNLHIYSYNSDTTKVLCYLTRQTGETTKCKVYFYTRKLFRMLITE